MVTVNELALAAKSDGAYIEELWLSVYKLIRKWAQKYRSRDGSSNRYDMDDLIQSAYFALLKAVGAYTAESGYQFTTFLYYHCMTEFASVLGIRTSKREPFIDSLDRPISDEDGSPVLMDTLEDESALEPFHSVEDDIYNKQLRHALDEAIQALPEQRQRVIQLVYFQGKTYKEAAADVGCTLDWVRQTKQAALRDLKRGRAAHAVRAFYYDMYGLRCTSLTAFRNTWTSSVEMAVEKKLELEERYAEIKGHILTPKLDS